MDKEKIKSEYTTIPIKLETKRQWDRIKNQLKVEEKVKYEEDFIVLLLNNFEENCKKV